MGKSSKLTTGRGAWCIVPNCYNKRQFTNAVFFTFPKEKSRCDTWLINCGREDLLKVTLGKNQVICAHHFEDGNFMDPFHKRLKPNAMPTIFSTSPNGVLALRLLPPTEKTIIGNANNNDNNNNLEDNARFNAMRKKKSYRQRAQEQLLRRRSKEAETVEYIGLESNESREMNLREEEENHVQPLENVSAETINIKNEPYSNSNSNILSLVLECESVILSPMPQRSYFVMNSDTVTLSLECESEPFVS